MFNSKWTLHRIHKWMGLVAAVWLIVLGSTGFLLDHRDTWRWLWQEGVAEKWVKDIVVDKSNTSQIRLYQINPHNSLQHVAGGLTGLWWSNNQGHNWLKTRFLGKNKAPMVSTILFDVDKNLWIATDNGLWLSVNSGKSASLIVLADKWVSALAINKKTKKLTGIIARTKIFNYSIESKQLYFFDINPVKLESLPDAISLSRFIRDVHYGRGVFTAPLSLLWNDISAIAMIMLPLTGLFFYGLPRKWRRDKAKNKKVSHKIKKHSIQWLFRLHGPTFGLVSALPFIYLSLTGILLDHGKEFRGWMKSVEVKRNWQTPVYNLKSWQGEIYGVVSYIDNPKKISVGTRLGLFTTLDNGKNWLREQTLENKASFVWTLRRHKENIFIGGMGSANMVKQGDKPWTEVKGVGHMPSDVTVDDTNSWLWKSRHGLKVSNTKLDFHYQHMLFPSSNIVPWFYIIESLHSGVLIHSQWKWVNDVIAIMAILLVITGLIRWWKKKWI